MKITTKLVQAAMGTCMPARYVVKVDGVEVGLLEKYKTTRTEIHPWKAFAGIGNTRFLKSFYVPDGGKNAAIRTVVNEYLPYGKSVMLRKGISGVECWNFTDETTGVLPANKTLVINHVYDATHTTCTVLDGIICSNGQRGWRFIVPNAVLADAAGVFVPSKTRDIVGEIIRAESK